jgi:hypothetical protein
VAVTENIAGKLAGLLVIAAAFLFAGACTDVDPDTAASPTRQVIGTPTSTPNAATATSSAWHEEIAATLESTSDEELEASGFTLTPFMEELEQMGQRSSLYFACQAPEGGGVAGSQFAGESVMQVVDTFGPILDRGMGGVSLACIIDKKSSLGGSQITLIYDLTNIRWIATEPELRRELEGAGLHMGLIEGAYAEYDFFPSGSLRISDISGLGLPEGLRAQISFLISDVVVGISNPDDVCGSGESDVPHGPAEFSDVIDQVKRDLASALNAPLTSYCVTWSEYGDVTAVDFELETDVIPADTLDSIRDVFTSYGATDISVEGYDLYGGVTFTGAAISGRSVTGIASLNGNNAFEPEDEDPVEAYLGITLTLQISDQ